MIANVEFDIGKWLGRALFEPFNYLELGNYVADKKRLRDYALSKEFYSCNQDGEFLVTSAKIAILENRERELYVEGLSDSIITALRTLSCQMIVVAMSLIEAMIQEYCECLFIRHPSRMYDYLEVDGKRGMVRLRILTESESRDEAIALLARECANRVLDGKFEACLKRVSTFSKQEIDVDLQNGLLKLSKLRNRIVHESSSLDIWSTNVQDAFEIMKVLLKWLGESAVSNEVPVNDPANLVIEDNWPSSDADR